MTSDASNSNKVTVMNGYSHHIQGVTKTTDYMKRWRKPFQLRLYTRILKMAEESKMISSQTPVSPCLAEIDNLEVLQTYIMAVEMSPHYL